MMNGSTHGVHLFLDLPHKRVPLYAQEGYHANNIAYPSKIAFSLFRSCGIILHFLQ